MMPTLHDGDIVLVDLGRRTPTPPGVFVPLRPAWDCSPNGWSTHHQQRSAASPHHFG